MVVQYWNVGDNGQFSDDDIFGRKFEIRNVFCGGPVWNRPGHRSEHWDLNDI